MKRGEGTEINERRTKALLCCGMSNKRKKRRKCTKRDYGPSDDDKSVLRGCGLLEDKSKQHTPCCNIGTDKNEIELHALDSYVNKAEYENDCIYTE